MAPSNNHVYPYNGTYIHSPAGPEAPVGGCWFLGDRFEASHSFLRVHPQIAIYIYIPGFRV